MPTQSYNTGNEIYDNNYGNQNVIADYKYISDLLANIPDNMILCLSNIHYQFFRFEFSLLFEFFFVGYFIFSYFLL